MSDPETICPSIMSKYPTPKMPKKPMPKKSSKGSKAGFKKVYGF